ncbi:MAG: division/cell wall cluster transcriptional repressor MraZ [Gammaproteobacteria bacterium]|nr:division/cell wall cluster transcriptional repressor MraZ [Gammaproteobacteria bacterium]
MLRGVNTLNLDAKGRMAIPSRYRDRLSSQCDRQVVVTLDIRDPCLLLYPLPEWETIERELGRLGNLNTEARRLQRILIGHATDLEMDGNGRILLPPALRKTVDLEKHIALVGQGNKFEIWNEDTWNSQRDSWLASNEDEGALSTQLESLSL